ncbi:hypothetical protein ACFLQ6_00940 [Thermoproteota archaeon]
MSEDTRLNLLLLFYICLSLIGLFTVLMFALKAPTQIENIAWRKPLIGSIFASICIAGSIATLFPKRCSGLFNLQKRENSKISHGKISKLYGTVRGHHIECEKFSTHTLQIQGTIVCAGCTGLLLGAMMALSGTILYFFSDWKPGLAYFPMVLIGITGIILGFIQLKFRGFLRLVLNTFFVLGAYLIIVALDNLAKNIFIDFYLIGLIILWICTRIFISQWDHSRICRSCKLNCEHVL